MLKNRFMMKRIRNICIFVMAIAILVGIYTYIRRSRAENVVPIEIEVADKSESIETQTITIEATEAQDGNYILTLPTSVNGIIVNKYYLSDGTEIDMKDENAEKTITLTEEQIVNPNMQMQTDYDKK